MFKGQCTRYIIIIDNLQDGFSLIFKFKKKIDLTEYKHAIFIGYFYHYSCNLFCGCSKLFNYCHSHCLSISFCKSMKMPKHVNFYIDLYVKYMNFCFRDRKVMEVYDTP